MSIMVLAFWSAAFAQEAALLKPFPATVRRNEVVEFRPQASHHFSLEAPQKCGALRPVDASARTIKCQFLTAGENSATLNVCDDKKTFCKPVAVKLQVSDQAAPDPVRLERNEPLNFELKKTLAPGFITGTFEEIEKKAKLENKAVLVLISTDWCPPCNEAKEYLLESKAFLAATQNWIKAYVDGDSFGAVAWEKKVPYKYYPSFVLLNDRMEEVGRFNSELRQAEFSKWAEEQNKYLGDPIEKLKGRVLARKNGNVIQKLKDLFGGEGPAKRNGDDVRLLKWAIDQRKHDIVQKVSDGSNYPELNVELARYQISKMDEDPNSNKTLKLALYKDLVEATFQRDDWAETVDGLCDESVDECKAYTGKIAERLQFLTSRNGLTDAERASMLGEEYFFLADIFEKLNDKNLQKDFARKCISSYEKLLVMSRLKLGRAAQQVQLACFEMAGKFDEAGKRLATLVQVYPNEPTFMVRMARLFRKQKKLDQALKWLEKGERVAYGFNWFNAQLIKSEILLDLKREKDALQVLNDAIAEVRLTEDNNRNQIVAARLRAAQTKIRGIVH